MEATTATDGAAHGLRRRPAATAACVLAALATLAVFLLAATPAFAGFELVQEFAKSGEGQLVAPFEVAVN
ncbi:MAG TPA: hypothetical protein VMB05_15035, partial [Solirubrobacteraceae bacterium]|nr:hypothetical protein [Solirubrobacteraceae bacterium]